MRIKSVFDPGWRLNPAKVFPLDASESLRAGLAARAPEAA
jgi:glycolate oxidase